MNWRNQIRPASFRGAVSFHKRKPRDCCFFGAEQFWRNSRFCFTAPVLQQRKAFSDLTCQIRLIVAVGQIKHKAFETVKEADKAQGKIIKCFDRETEGSILEIEPARNF